MVLMLNICLAYLLTFPLIKVFQSIAGSGNDVWCDEWCVPENPLNGHQFDRVVGVPRPHYFNLVVCLFVNKLLIEHPFCVSFID
jgi:hypothetical protein